MILRVCNSLSEADSNNITETDYINLFIFHVGFLHDKKNSEFFRGLLVHPLRILSMSWIKQNPNTFTLRTESERDMSSRN